MTDCQIFDKNNIDELQWEDFEQGKGLKQLFLPLIRDGLQRYITNTDSEMVILTLNKHIFPLTIANTQSKLQNTYLCSTLTQYFDLAIEEIAMEMKGKRSFIAWLAPKVLNTLRFVFKKLKFEHTVFVNNWILATNLYPNFDLNKLDKAKKVLRQRFHKKAIIFRSVNSTLNKDLFEVLKQQGFVPIISRPVLALFPEKEKYKKKRMYKSDQKLWDKNKEYTWDSVLQEQESEKIRQLYEALYLEKYSSLNPSYTSDFIDLLYQSQVLDFQMLREKGKIFGITAFFERNGEITTPLIGYDQSIPLKVGLYRFLNYRLMQEAIENQLTLNMSSGAAQFKRMRGGEPTLEYNMVYYKHLPFWRSLPWRVYYWFSERFAIPSIQRYEL